ncbi:MAG: adenylate/guanylate cyclase domain-containing protein, partial [Pseudomonadota bacterium]
GGMLDKFIGDGAMASFGIAGEKVGDPPASRAIACAKAILAATNEWNVARGGQPIRISIGVHYGPVVVGDVGSSRRMELAVIGDAVNVASRLEEMTRTLGVRAAISEETVKAAGDQAGLSERGPQPVLGREEPVIVWAVTDR